MGGLRDTLKNLGDRFLSAVRAGRTHGQIAEATSLGWTFIVPDRTLALSVPELPLKASGATGSYSNTSWETEQRFVELVSARVGLRFISVPSTQVVHRAYYARVFSELAVLASVLDGIATEMRHLAMLGWARRVLGLEAGSAVHRLCPTKIIPQFSRISLDYAVWFAAICLRFWRMSYYGASATFRTLRLNGLFGRMPFMHCALRWYD